MFLSLIYTLFIGPLELFFEVLFTISYRFFHDPGVSIVFLSLAMNFLVLPLYRRADAMQEEERKRAAKMKRGSDHIKKTFKGDERFMMLQTYNRQNGYKPTDALKGSVSLLLEIPFFIAAFHFLSNLALLKGVSFGPLADLGAPDALLQIGDLTINVLPILMTAINLISAFIYMKGMPLQNKIQMYGIAAIFLVLLYNSPAGLVFYWTLNNIFSLVKNVFYKLKRPGFVLSVIASLTGLGALVYCLFVDPLPTALKQAFVIGFGLALQLPLAISLFSRTQKWTPPSIAEATESDTRAFFLCGLFLALLTGALIPSTVIGASPAEFVNLITYESPLWYVAQSLAMSIGVFVIWFGVFYWLATPTGKTIFGCAMFAATGVAIVNYLFFGMSLGNLSPELQFEDVPSLDASQVVINIAVIAVITIILALLWKHQKRVVGIASVSMCIAVAVMSCVNAIGINQNLDSIKATIASSADGDNPHASLSTDGKNVVVIMLDRAITDYLPYLFAERPELKEKMDGFTYYPNAVSFGVFTNIGTPGLYGGYDYTPENMNARANEPLVAKQNEALKVMPTVFSENGFETTVFDPTYAGYGAVPDLSVFDDLPDVHTYVTMTGMFETEEILGAASSQNGLSSQNLRNFFCYSVFKISPLIMQPTLYHKGDYNSSAALSLNGSENTSDLYTKQIRNGSSKSSGVDQLFMESYAVLQNMPNITPVEKGNKDTFLVMSNDTTHAPMVLKEPEYIPALAVDNSEFDAAHEKRYAEDGSSLAFPPESGDVTSSPIMHYEVNMAAFRELCNWFDYLRQQGAWDNTRIIIVSDHGRDLKQHPDMLLEVEKGTSEQREIDLLMGSCMLLVKDFDSTGFTVDERFMTNADTPALAMEGLIENPVNPYTGNPIDSAVKNSSEQHLLFSWDWSTTKNNGNTFLPGYWFTVHDDIHKPENWEYLGYR